MDAYSAKAMGVMMSAQMDDGNGYIWRTSTPICHFPKRKLRKWHLGKLGDLKPIVIYHFILFSLLHTEI